MTRSAIPIPKISTDSVHYCTAGCGTHITWRFAICTNCEAEYGRSARDWPEWLRYSWNDIQRQRRAAKKNTTNEILVYDFDEASETGTVI